MDGEEDFYPRLEKTALDDHSKIALHSRTLIGTDCVGANSSHGHDGWFPYCTHNHQSDHCINDR